MRLTSCARWLPARGLGAIPTGRPLRRWEPVHPPGRPRRCLPACPDTSATRVGSGCRRSPLRVVVVRMTFDAFGFQTLHFPLLGDQKHHVRDTNSDFKRKLLRKTEEKVRGYRSVALNHYCGNGYAFCVMISRKLASVRRLPVVAESARQVLLDAREPGSGKPLEKAPIPCGLALVGLAALDPPHGEF